MSLSRTISLVAIRRHGGDNRSGIDVEPGEYILVHCGHAGRRLDQALAARILAHSLEDEPDAPG